MEDEQHSGLPNENQFEKSAGETTYIEMIEKNREREATSKVN